MKTIAYIMSTYHIGTHNLDIQNILKSYIIARYYGWEPKEEDLEEIISHTSFFDINVDDAIYEVLTMPREKINHLKTKNLWKQQILHQESPSVRMVIKY